MTVSTIFSQLMTFATKLSVIVDHNKPKSPMKVSGHCVPRAELGATYFSCTGSVLEWLLITFGHTPTA